MAMSKSKVTIVISKTGPSGNAFFIIGEVAKQMRSDGRTKTDIAQFRKDALASHNYEDLLKLCGKYVKISMIE